MPTDPGQRRAIARLGGHARARAAGSGAEVSAPARAAFLAGFERQVDPDGALAPEERARRARHALREHMARMALARSTKAARAGRRGGAPAPERVDPPSVNQAPLTWEEFLASREAG